MVISYYHNMKGDAWYRRWDQDTVHVHEQMEHFQFNLRVIVPIDIWTRAILFLNNIGNETMSVNDRLVLDEINLY